MKAISKQLVNNYVQLPAEFEFDELNFKRAKEFVNEYIILPILGKSLYDALNNSLQFGVIDWEAGTTSVVGNYYKYNDSYFKALVAVNTAPTIGTNWAKSELAYFWDKKIIPAYAWCIKSELASLANANLQNSAFQNYVTEAAVMASAKDVGNMRNELDLRKETVLNAVRQQLSEWDNTLDGVKYATLVAGKCCNNSSSTSTFDII